VANSDDLFMVIIRLKILIPLLLFVLVLIAPVQAEEFQRWDLLNNKPEHAEHLAYRLAYRGFLTGFNWMDLADVAIISSFQQTGFMGNKVCASSMRASTENYGFAENLHPVRYQWKSLSNAELDHTYLIDISDVGKSDNHNVTWVDWDDDEFRRYRKRQYRQAETSGWSFDSDEVVEEWYWEKDGREVIPEFLAKYPPVNDGSMSYFIHDDTRPLEKKVAAVDPLVMVRRARGHDFDQQSSMQVAIIAENEIEQFQITLLGREDYVVGETTVPALKLKSVMSEDPEGKEGWMMVWLTDDDARVPLNFQVEAPFGKMRVQITEQSLKQARASNNGVPVCSVVKHD
jgi:hypothetical protein